MIGYAAIELFSALATRGDGVAHIAHLGGMVFGFFMIRYWRKQMDGGYHNSSAADSFDKLRNMFGGRNKKTKQGFDYTRNENYTRNDNYSRNDTYTTDFQRTDEAEERKKAAQKEIDRILDKIRKSGYDSLTREEKQTLFDQSNR